MPLYDYRCPGCGATTEVLRSMESTDDERCPACDQVMDRAISRPADFRNLRPRQPGKTCCGRDERCDTPPCGDGRSCCK